MCDLETKETKAAHRVSFSKPTIFYRGFVDGLKFYKDCPLQ